ncbi:MAG: hypothetical protein L0Y64_06040, partial [Myxococcaceae bacterium]|nr:hypothetical protein [Myxococcaceae bacterium]
MKPRSTLSLLLCLVTLALPTTSRAHAGLPETTAVTVREGHPDDLLVRASFGALLSHDGGRTWGWVCPEVMGAAGAVPEHFLWHADGELLAAGGRVLIRSRDGGCSWEASPVFEDTWVRTLATHPSLPERLFAATEEQGEPNEVRRSNDGGRTFPSVVLRREDAAFTSVLVAPGAPQRVYAAAQEETPGGGALVFRSNDGGETWSEHAHAAEALGGRALTLLAVSPANADVLLARVRSEGPTRVVRSDDGGQSFTEVLALGNAVLDTQGTLGPDEVVGADLSANGQTAWVATWTGIYRSTDGGLTFARLGLPNGNGCARDVGGRLYGCGSPWVHGWALATSTDSGDSWQPLLTFQDIQGVAACPADSPARRVCEPYYPNLAALLNIT